MFHIVKGFSVINEAEVELPCFLHNSTNAGNLISCSSASSKSTLYWKVFSSHIAEAWLGEFWALLYYPVRWVQLCISLSILWHCLSLGLVCKLTFSSPVAIAEFSKFAGLLSAALSQHHLLGFEIVQRIRCYRQSAEELWSEVHDWHCTGEKESLWTKLVEVMIF